MSNSENQSELSRLAVLAEDLFDAQHDIERLTEELSKAKDREAKLSQSDIPNLMDELGIKTYSTTTGLEISVQDNIRASITKANLAKAVEWLEANGQGGIIKRELRVNVGKGREELIKRISELANSEQVACSQEPSVHPQTLSACVRELLEGGTEVPLELLGVFHGRQTKMKVPKT